jgi:hypothetical protein
MRISISALWAKEACVRIRRLVGWLLAGVACVFLWTISPSAAEPKAEQAPNDRKLAAEFARLRDRVDELEQRVAKLEAKTDRLEVDRHGVIRNSEGNPVGFWGVDIGHGSKAVRPR